MELWIKGIVDNFDNIKYANHWRQPVESEFQADFQSDWQAQLGGNGDTSGVSRMVLHITDTGLLAASHREGAGAVHNYLSHLEKDQNGHYHIDYDKIQDPKMRAMFKRIETRLRRFAK